MPRHDETLIWIEEINPPHIRMSFSHYSWQNVTQIRRRTIRLARKYTLGWHCSYCGDLMPVWKRVDAAYCKESCRKLAARKRRERRREAR